MSREEAIRKLQKLKAEYLEEWVDFSGVAEAYDMAIEALAIDPVKHGRWKKTYLDHEAIGERPSIFYCSVCNQCIAYPVNYCPSCGADMRGEEDE